MNRLAAYAMLTVPAHEWRTGSIASHHEHWQPFILADESELLGTGAAGVGASDAQQCCHHPDVQCHDEPVDGLVQHRQPDGTRSGPVTIIQRGSKRAAADRGRL